MLLEEFDINGNKAREDIKRGEDKKSKLQRGSSLLVLRYLIKITSLLITKDEVYLQVYKELISETLKSLEENK